MTPGDRMTGRSSYPHLSASAPTTSPLLQQCRSSQRTYGAQYANDWIVPIPVARETDTLFSEAVVWPTADCPLSPRRASTGIAVLYVQEAVFVGELANIFFQEPGFNVVSASDGAATD
jgi:hypothetical protein